MRLGGNFLKHKGHKDHKADLSFVPFVFPRISFVPFVLFVFPP